MFQMWGKLVENNHILQDLTVCIDDEDTRTHKVFRALDESAMPGIWRSRSGSIRIFRSLNGDRKRGSHRIILLNRWSLIIWRFRLQRNNVLSFLQRIKQMQKPGIRRTWERLFLQSPLRFRRMSGSFYVFCPWLCIPFIPRGFPCRLPGTKQYFSAPVRSGACGLPSMPRRCAA